MFNIMSYAKSLYTFIFIIVLQSNIFAYVDVIFSSPFLGDSLAYSFPLYGVIRDSLARSN